MKMLRTVLKYAAMAVGVSVGGVVIGAIVVAPAISRSKPLFERAFDNNVQQLEETGGAVGQADGDPLNAGRYATVVAVAPFTPLAEAIASDQTVGIIVGAPRQTGLRRFTYEVAHRLDDALLAAGRVPKILWVFADIGAVLLMAGVWFWRRRAGTPALANLLPLQNLDTRLTASVSTKLVAGRSSRTPTAVASLAEAGNSPAQIARRTGLALDAVAMLMSMGSLGARQLQPPTA